MSLKCSKHCFESATVFGLITCSELLTLFCGAPAGCTKLVSPANNMFWRPGVR